MDSVPVEQLVAVPSHIKVTYVPQPVGSALPVQPVMEAKDSIITVTRTAGDHRSWSRDKRADAGRFQALKKVHELSLNILEMPR